MGWLKLRQVLFREGLAQQQQQQQHVLGPQDAPRTPAAAAGRNNSSSSSTHWDPWRADSEVHISYELQQQQQQQQGSAAAASLGLGSSQAPEGSAVVWDSSNTPQEWDWNAFAAAEGCR
jgi:hypothetical protein